ncbi:hypothetical protein [Thioclava sp. GXIMD4216]|uniref:hypothetical protein n=1 Tax=Thioclava sp. GXIMD4216 TaxID=3131929 RepID=UPI0030CFEDC3
MKKVLAALALLTAASTAQAQGADSLAGPTSLPGVGAGAYIAGGLVLAVAVGIAVAEDDSSSTTTTTN